MDFLDLELEEEEEEREEREEREELLREAEDFRMVGVDRGRDVWGEDGFRSLLWLRAKAKQSLQKIGRPPNWQRENTT